MSKEQYKIGYIMPISDTEGYENGHWENVKEILNDVIEDFKSQYETIDVSYQIVSDNENDQNIIQKSIVQNIYNSDLVICDVSAKNPNVMFELGIRLAFDKKIILVKDDHTGYNFDTSPIKHLEYAKDLNYQNIKKFKKNLLKEIDSNFKSENLNGGYLQAFSDITVKSIVDSEINEADALSKIIEKIDTLDNKVNDVVRLYEKNSKADKYRNIDSDIKNLKTKFYDSDLNSTNEKYKGKLFSLGELEPITIKANHIDIKNKDYN